MRTLVEIDGFLEPPLIFQKMSIAQHRHQMVRIFLQRFLVLLLGLGGLVGFFIEFGDGKVKFRAGLALRTEQVGSSVGNVIGFRTWEKWRLPSC